MFFFLNKSRIFNSSKIDQGSPSNYSAAYLASKFRISFVLPKAIVVFSSEATAPLDIAETDARSSGKRYIF